jgi:hypothetical protein
MQKIGNDWYKIALRSGKALLNLAKLENLKYIGLKLGRSLVIGQNS